MAVAALFIGGCGTATPADPPGPGATPSAATSSTKVPLRFGAGGADAVSPSVGPEFPLTLRRTGGIAGFDDRVVLEADGRIHVETPTVHGRVCRLPAVQQRQLLTLLATLRLTPVPTDEGSGLPSDPGPSESDPITIAVTDDLARTVDLSDPSLGEIAGLVATLVSDVTLTAPTTSTCTTPTPAQAAPTP